MDQQRVHTKDNNYRIAHSSPVDQWDIREQLLDHLHPGLLGGRDGGAGEPGAGEREADGDAEHEDEDHQGEETPVLPPETDACKERRKYGCVKKVEKPDQESCMYCLHTPILNHVVYAFPYVFL